MKGRKQRIGILLGAYCLLVIGIGVGAAIALARSAGPLRPLGAYTTPLGCRTRDQVFNARLAARSLDGAVIMPGQTFSFNRRVGSWSIDTGYRKAPVSYGGEMIRDWGGGVCQTSTTLYNAALISGMTIVERHRHQWPPSYVPPGRDAAVAFENIDLRFRNPYDWPVTIRAATQSSRLTISILARHTPDSACTIVSSVQGMQAPQHITRIDAGLSAGRTRTVVHGAPGVDVAVYRIIVGKGGKRSREFVSHDVYPVLHELRAVGAGQ